MFVNPNTGQPVPGGGVVEASLPPGAALDTQQLGDVAPPAPPVGEAMGQNLLKKVPTALWVALGLGAAFWGWRMWRNRS